MPEVQFPVPNVPIVEPKTGRFTRQGRWFLHEILQRIGGLGDITGLFTSDIGVTVQAWDAELDAIAALTPTDSNFIVGDGATWVTESGATARASLGLIIGTDVQADLDVVSQADAEAGTATDERIWTAERVKQAIAALETTGDVVDDTTPQLGGNLDVNGNSIVSASDGDIPITPDGTGDIILDGQKWPQADGTNTQIISTDGLGQLSWIAKPAGSGDSLPIVDTTNIVKGSADATKQVRIEADTNIATGITRVIIMADQDIDLTPGVDFQADLDVPSQAEAEAGTATTERVWTAERVKQAIAALETGGGTFRGALVKPAADITTANYTAGVNVPFDEEIHDTDSIHDNVTNNTRLTVPSGVTWVELLGHFRVDAISSGQWIAIQILKGGLSLDPLVLQRNELTSTSSFVECKSPPLSVTGGEYFEMNCQVESDTSVTVRDNTTWFSMKILE